MLVDQASERQDRVYCQPSSSRMALSPGVLAALERVHRALRKASSSVPSLPMLAERLAEDGLLVTLRSGLGVGSESPDYLATLRHSFLICQEGSSGLCVIVDPSFREQFKVAGMPPTSAYSTAVANVPECFVGTIGTVNALVCLLTGTLLQESTALGIELPPWRSKQALLSNWLPRRFADTVFAPPSFVPLHPALRSSVHGAAAAAFATSPTSVQSWPSLGCTHTAGSSDLASSHGSSAACGSATTTDTTVSSGDERSSARSSLSQPRTVITGFTASPTKCTAAAAASASAAAPRACPARSALTEQLVSASNLSRAVQVEAEAHWQRCLMNLRGSNQPATTALQKAPIAAAAAAAPTVIIAAPPTASELFDVAASGCSSLKAPRVPAGSIHGGVLHSLVVSPVHRRAGCGQASLKRGSSCSLKLPAATLKMLPRVYTVKVATTSGC